MSNRRFIASVTATAAATDVVLPWARRRMAPAAHKTGAALLTLPTRRAA